MDQKPRVTPQDFFLWIGAMLALYIAVWRFVLLWFEYIDRLVGNPALSGYDPYSSEIRWAIASLIVIIPVYLILTRILNQDIRQNPEKKELWVRRWLIYITLFAAAVTLVTNLVVLLNAFLGGEELTAAFLLKIFTVFVVAGGVFWYYFNDIRGYWETREALSLYIGAGVGPSC